MKWRIIKIGFIVTIVFLSFASIAKAQEWTLFTRHTDSGETTTVMEGVITTSIKDFINVEISFQPGYDCGYYVHCGGTSCEFNCIAGLQCTWIYITPIYIDDTNRTWEEITNQYKVYVRATGSKIIIIFELFDTFNSPTNGFLQVSLFGTGVSYLSEGHSWYFPIR